MNQRWKFSAHVAILSTAWVIAGCNQAPVATQSVPPKVEVGQPVTRELVDEDDYNGWLRASAIVEVRSRVRGHIEKIHFKDGDLVQTGQLLFELDPRPFQVQIDLAKSQVKSLEAQQVAAVKDYARYMDLVKTGAVSQSETEKIQADAESFAAQVEAKKEEVKQHELDLEFSKITAPIAGRISRAELTVGNLVNAGGSDPLLTTIVAQDPIYVYFSVDERSLQRYMNSSLPDAGGSSVLRERRLPFRFGLDTDTGYPHEGVLDFADNQINAETGTIQLRGVVDNKQGRFVPGSRVRIRVPVSEPYTAVVVPDTAILSDQDKRYVLVVDDKNVVSRRDLQLGRLLDDGMRVVVPNHDGSPAISPDERIIVRGLQRARIDYPVDPVTPAAPLSS